MLPTGDAPSTPWVATPSAPSSSAAPKSPKSQASDYSHLLLQAEDVSIPPDTFTARSSNVNPDGQSGASALFVNADDTRAIADTILIYPDVATATATLKQASAAVSTMVTGGQPEPVPVGTNGTVISGTAPDGKKAVTLLMYTQGRAVVRPSSTATRMIRCHRRRWPVSDGCSRLRCESDFRSGSKGRSRRVCRRSRLNYCHPGSKTVTCSS